jgi:plastocyanin
MVQTGGVSRRRRLAPALAAAGALAVVGALPALGVDVILTDDGFEPETVTIAPGGQIVWANQSDRTYTIVGENGVWDSGPLEPGSTFSLALQREGEYGYATADGVHTGTVVVAAIDAPPDEQPEEPPPDPVMPRTGIPFLTALGVAGLLIGIGGALVGRGR